MPPKNGPGDRRSSGRRTRKRKPAEPADLKQPAKTVKEVSRLCQKMATAPDVETARELKFKANELETFFGEIRRNSHDYLAAVLTELEAETKSKAALSALGKAFLITEPDQAAVPSPLVESPLLAPDVETLHREHFATIMGSAQRALFRTAVLENLQPPRALSTPPPSDTGIPLDLHEFFQSVSQSVIDAQQTLDSLSLGYARQQQGAAIPGSLYSIPTVKAEVKAGLSKSAGGGLLVKLVKDDQSTSYADSTISFDVVASPPPPGRLDRFTAPIPRFLVVDGGKNGAGADGQSAADTGDRAEVINAIPASPTAAPPFDGDWKKRTVVIRDMFPSHAAPGKMAFLALVPGQPPKPGNGAVDLSAVSLAVFLYEQPGPIQTINVPAGPLKILLVRLSLSIGMWLDSVTAK